MLNPLFLQWNFAVDQLNICDLPHLRVPSTLLHEAHRHDQVSQGGGNQVREGSMWLLNGLVHQPSKQPIIDLFNPQMSTDPCPLST